tara:strand:- start:127 stop:1032 length:906 start_codon:yes stop_codon:yes gene_type:complete
MGGAITALILSIMGSEYFKNLSDDHQDALVDAPVEQLLDLDLTDPEYQKAVDEYYSEQGDFLHPKDTRPDLSGMSDDELKTHMRQAANKLMIAPEEIPSGMWRAAPVFQNETVGYYAFASEGDLMAMEEEYPGFDKAVQDAERFFEDMPITALWRYTFGQQTFFSYTSREDANAGKLFDTIELEQTILNPLTNERENIRVKKLPLAWTVANKVLVDRITIMHGELDNPELTRQEYEVILEKHGVVSTYFKRKRMGPDEVVQELIQTASNSIARMDTARSIPGKHSNKGETYTMKETLEEKC